MAWGDCYHRDVFVRVLYLLRACLPLVAVNDLTPFLLAAQYGDAANVRERSSRKDPLCPPASCVWGVLAVCAHAPVRGLGPGAPLHPAFLAIGTHRGAHPTARRVSTM